MRKINSFLLIIISTILLIGCNINKETEVSKLHIIPQPNNITNLGTTYFKVRKTVKINFINLDIENPTAQYIINYFPKLTNRNCKIVKAKENKNVISFILDKKTHANKNKEAYTIEVYKNAINVIANDEAGLFYGFQTIVQIISSDLNIKYIPTMFIQDMPRFSWRGAHLDVSRHFFDLDFIKKYIDILAINKINKFHWHLTDDHGWRIQIDKYPKLTEIGAWRVDRSNVPWLEGEAPKEGEPNTYGGYYTKDQMKEIVQYAAERHVDVMPEIDIPGHSSAILAAYPEFSCDDYPYYVQIGPYWPPKAILCAGTDKTLDFLYDVIDELIEIFPYEYIHIGGDEAFKDNWRLCPKCQARIKKEGLKNEEELQSWLIHKLEEYIISKGRKMMGWDEIIEGGLSPSSTIMSWRGIDGGITAAKAGNDVVMTPNTFCYFDYYQADPCCQPKAIGGFLPLKTVYEFNPVPEALNEKEAKHILGGQCNVWTEFIYTPEHAEYMLLPRLAALSESVWTLKKEKCWSNFKDKIVSYKQNLKSWGYNYCEGSFKPEISTTSTEQSMLCFITSEVKDVDIYYTLDGSKPTKNSKLYNGPFEVTETVTLNAIAYYQNEEKDIPTKIKLFKPSITSCDISIATKPSEKYKGNGIATLTDGILGDVDNFTNGKWLGFNNDKLKITIKNKDKNIKSIAVNFLANTDNWIFIPPTIEIRKTDNNLVLKKVTTKATTKSENKIETISFDFETPITEEKIDLFITNHRAIPKWHSAAGAKPWIFIDEIIVEKNESNRSLL